MFETIHWAPTQIPAGAGRLGDLECILAPTTARLSLLLLLGLIAISNVACNTVTVAGNCIHATNGGNIDNHHGNSGGYDDSSCKVTTNIIVLRPQTARAILKNAAGEEIGTALLFVKVGEGVAIATQIHGLAPGKYTTHVLVGGKCDFNQASNADGRSLADLPSFDVGADGRGNMASTMNLATLDDGPNGLLGKEGAAIVIEKVDGAAASRVACGVVNL